jgi:hypothetical protein
MYRLLQRCRRAPTMCAPLQERKGRASLRLRWSPDEAALRRKDDEGWAWLHPANYRPLPRSHVGKGGK